ncbi:MAG: nucleotide exchange factor GrpE, partial [Endomicrobium sp.]|nr:nucleotide exchange factor GrpE [Endomicrobium sp.]
MENGKETQEQNQQDCDCHNSKRDEKISEIEILRQSVDGQKALAQDYYDQLIRLRADFENFRKRSEKEKKDYLD